MQEKKRKRIEEWQQKVKADPANAPKEPDDTDDDWITFECTCGEFGEHVVAVSTGLLGVLFLICMVCHGELVKSKPQPKYLTSFYLFISLGGALGGLFVALICPLIFKSHFELALAMIGGFIVGWMAIMQRRPADAGSRAASCCSGPSPS